MQLSFQQVTFSYEGAPTPLLESVTLHFAEGWTGIVGANGSGKTTLLLLACGALSPLRGEVLAPGPVLYCPQRTETPPPHFAHFLAAADREACRLRGVLHLEPSWAERWDTLSHGERKRLQIAVALWQDPPALALDEPTNHLDAAASRMLAEALAGYRGIGLLVSHQRDLLDTLCQQCLFVEPPAAVLRPGNYSAGAAQALQEETYQREQRELAGRTLQKLEREVTQRRQAAAGADKKRSKRKLALRDHDAREKIDRARIAGSDGRAGRLADQMQGRLLQAEEKLASITVKKRYSLGIWLPGARARRDLLLAVPEGSLPLGKKRQLRFPALQILPADRIALTGVNGTGKSTLLRYLHSQLKLPEERVISLPQEVSIARSRALLRAVRTLPREEQGRVMTVISCLGTRPERLLESDTPSPGETRKLLLALGMIRDPYLILMDEPTNHLDLPAIECLEEALDECPCALLLISHDYRFLRRLARSRWHLEQDADGDSFLRQLDADAPW